MKKIEFNTASNVPILTEENGQLHYFTDAARIEASAADDAKRRLLREPLSRLIFDGEALGPVALKRTGKYEGEATPIGSFPLDGSELSPGKTAMVVNANHEEVAEIVIRKVEKKVVTFKSPGPDTWEIPHGEHFLLKKENNTSWEAHRKLRDSHIVWPAPNLPTLLNGETGGAETNHTDNFVECLKICTAENILAGIKGPPGTGKTYLLAWAACILARQGKTCYVTSSTHKAIEAALLTIADVAQHVFPELKTAKKPKSGEKLPDNVLAAGIETSGKILPQSFESYQVIGVTLSSLLSTYNKSKDVPLVDFMLIDEGSQVPAFTACAASTFAKNMVIFGDENQLEPVLQGDHHDYLDSAKSAIAFLRARLPGRTKTLLVNHHANTLSVAYTQKHHYQDIELQAGRNKDCRVEEVECDLNGTTRPLPCAGTYFLEITHQNRKKHAPEESLAAAAIVTSLLGKTYHNPEGDRPLTGADFAVLCPNKRQAENVRRALEASLPEGETIPDCGTVHKLQGQGRPVVIFCTTASHIGYIETLAEFLFKTELWNVATSRAKAVTYILGNKGAIQKAIPKTLAGFELKTKVLAGLDETPTIS